MSSTALDIWIDHHERTWRRVEGLGLPDVRDWWLWGVLDAAIQPLLDDVERADGEQWRTLRDHACMLLESPGVWTKVSAESRVKLWLLRHDHRPQLEEFAAARLFSNGDRPTVVREGKVWALLPFHDDAALGVPRELYEMTAEETRLRTMLREVRWTGGERFVELTVFAAIDFVHLEEPPTVTCALVEESSGERIDLTVGQYRDPRGNQRGRRFPVVPWGAFDATVDAAKVVAASQALGLADTGRTWVLDVYMMVGGVSRSGPVTQVDEQGSAGLIGQPHLAPRLVEGALVGFSPATSVTGLRVLPASGAPLAPSRSTAAPVRGVLELTDVPLVAVQAGSPTHARPDRGGSRRGWRRGLPTGGPGAWHYSRTLAGHCAHRYRGRARDRLARARSSVAGQRRGCGVERRGRSP